ncbi:ABC transporter ATP-binding protein [Streptomyces sp. NRRL B-3229]|uniref:ABC transporter ATP-binding protein n=1 Tax=Streptomyces sp. NRRL B-3229 TaxID=1463836 RepID=UPI0004BFB967|nr:ABC transporter ATP-binding protein [Streptomyces sp. NRRL B-3229]
MTAVRARGLTRSYPARKGSDGHPHLALDDFDLTVERGEIHGLLGPNGAGKTTLCRILCTVLLPTRGTAEVLGHDVLAEAGAVRRSIGIVFGGERGLYGRLTARQNLCFWAALYGLSGRDLHSRVDMLIARMGLGDRAHDRVDTMSRGMKQRLHIARGLVHDPSVLILDEPTIGMDPVAALAFRELIEQLRAEERTVLLTTHDMQEAEALCDRVTFADHGQAIVTESVTEVGSLLARGDRIEAVGVPDATVLALRKLPGITSVDASDNGRVRVIPNAESGTEQALRLLVDAGVTRISTAPPTLEEVYLGLIGNRGMAVRS